MKKLLASIVALGLAAGAAYAQDRPLRVGLVLPGPITDGTFNSAAHDGIKKAQAKYKLDVSIQENTTFAQSEEAMLNYARSEIGRAHV